MSPPAHRTGTRTYLMVWGALAVLTLVELGVASLGLGRGPTICLLVAFSAAKALLVAMYFMHLKFERVALVMIAAAPLLFAVILTLALLPDISFGG